MCPCLGAYYNGPKFKYQPTSGTGWFSYEMWTKNSKTPMVNLLKNLRPFWNYIIKIQWESHLLTFSNTDRNIPKKKFRIEIWIFWFEICFKNQFSTSGSGETENTQIRVFVYFPFDHFPKLKLILKADLKWECPYFYSKIFFGSVLVSIWKVKTWISPCILKM